jgi:hypothetical protein
LRNAAVATKSHFGLVLLCLACFALDAARGQTAVKSLPPQFWNGFLAGRAELARACPWPDDREYGRTTDIFKKGKQPMDALPRTPGKIDGCAVLRFHLDAHGNVTASQVAMEHPAGVSGYAITLLQAMQFQPGDPHAEYLIRFGMHRSSSGFWSIFQDIHGSTV